MPNHMRIPEHTGIDAVSASAQQSDTVHTTITFAAEQVCTFIATLYQEAKAKRPVYGHVVDDLAEQFQGGISNKKHGLPMWE